MTSAPFSRSRCRSIRRGDTPRWRHEDSRLRPRTQRKVQRYDVQSGVLPQHAAEKKSKSRPPTAKRAKVNVAPYLENQIDISAPIQLLPESEEQTPPTSLRLSCGNCGVGAVDDEGNGVTRRPVLPPRTATRAPRRPIVPQPIVATYDTALAARRSIRRRRETFGRRQSEDAGRNAEDAVAVRQAAAAEEIERRSRPFPAVLTASVYRARRPWTTLALGRGLR
jgi:hypothetical protein